MSPSEQERLFIEEIENEIFFDLFYYFMILIDINEDSWMKTMKSVEIEVKILLPCYLLFIYKHDGENFFNQFFQKNTRN